MKQFVKKRWNFLNPSKRLEEPEFIGVIGTGKCTGATHFAIMTAGYLSGVRRLRCAVLEWNRHGDFKSMETACSGEKRGKNAFRLLETDYYEAAGIETLLLCKTAGYQVVIVDYGCIRDGNLEEFLRCSRQFVLGSLSEWQMNEFMEFEQKEKKAERSWETFVSFGSEETRKNAERRLKKSVKRIPVSVDPFTVTSETMRFYEQLF